MRVDGPFFLASAEKQTEKTADDDRDLASNPTFKKESILFLPGAGVGARIDTVNAGQADEAAATNLDEGTSEKDEDHTGSAIVGTTLAAGAGVHALDRLNANDAVSSALQASDIKS